MKKIICISLTLLLISLSITISFAHLSGETSNQAVIMSNELKTFLDENYTGFTNKELELMNEQEIREFEKNISKDIMKVVEEQLVDNYNALEINFDNVTSKTIKYNKILDDNVNIIDILAKSFDEPILVYSESLELGSKGINLDMGIKSSRPIPAVQSDTIMHNGTITTFSISVSAYYSLDDFKGDEVDSYMLSNWGFSWSRNVTDHSDISIEYVLVQNDVGRYRNDYYETDTYSWPDHHNHGSINRNVSPDVYSRVYSQFGYVGAAAEVSILFPDGTTKTKVVGAGWGNIGGILSYFF